jgi:hypothetical protein
MRTGRASVKRPARNTKTSLNNKINLRHLPRRSKELSNVMENYLGKRTSSSKMREKTDRLSSTSWR